MLAAIDRLRRRAGEPGDEDVLYRYFVGEPPEGATDESMAVEMLAALAAHQRPGCN